MTETANKLLFSGYYSPVSSKGVSLLTGIKSSDLSNRKRNNLDFPQDHNNEQGAPIYWFGEVMRWAYARKIKINGKEVIYRDIEILERESMNPSLNIAIVGRARTGKSFLSSYFIGDTVYMRLALCSAGTDYTQIPTKIVVDGNSPFFRFTVFEELASEVPEDIKHYINTGVSIDPGSPDFQTAMDRINEWLRDLHNGDHTTELNQKVSLEIHGKPSAMSKRIMEKTGKRVLVITDTPGASGNYEYSFEELGRQDIVIIAMRDENMMEFAESFNRIATLVGTNPVIYSYRTSEGVDDEDEYNEEIEEGRKAMESFESSLAKAFDKDFVIASSINALHPTDHFVVLPSFKSRKYKPVEDVYTRNLESQIIREYNARITPSKVSNELEKAGVDKDTAMAFLKKAIYIPKTLPVDVASRDAAVAKFRNATHARVKSHDNYRICEIVNKCCVDELSTVRTVLEGFTVRNCPEEWKRVLVQYIYQTVDRTLKTFPGVGIGVHPWEDSPAVTMRTCESVFADDLYAELKGYAERTEYSFEDRADVTSRYRVTLQKNNIVSRSWDRVVANPYTINTLRILLRSGLLETRCRPDHAEADLIKNCAVMGLLFQTIVDIYSDVLRGVNAFTGTDDIVNMVKEAFDAARQIDG